MQQYGHLNKLKIAPFWIPECISCYNWPAVHQPRQTGSNEAAPGPLPKSDNLCMWGKKKWPEGACNNTLKKQKSARALEDSLGHIKPCKLAGKQVSFLCECWFQRRGMHWRVAAVLLSNDNDKELFVNIYVATLKQSLQEEKRLKNTQNQTLNHYVVQYILKHIQSLILFQWNALGRAKTWEW